VCLRIDSFILLLAIHVDLKSMKLMAHLPARIDGTIPQKASQTSDF
jgi:hypothetical protein